MVLSSAARRTRQQLIVAVAGDIDLAVYPRLQAEAEAWAGEGLDVVLDCSAVTFMDSMGLRALIQLRQDLTDSGHTLALTNVSTPVSRVLELAGVQALFERANGVQSAEESVA